MQDLPRSVEDKLCDAKLISCFAVLFGIDRWTRPGILCGMTFPTKGLKAINHRDTHYRWIYRNRAGKNELWVEMSASAAGQHLIADVPKVVNHEMVPLAIDYARAHGWDPIKSAPPFRCKYLKGSFVAIDS